MRENIDPEEWERAEQELFAPITFNGRDPDAVTQDVIEDEMSLFMNFSRQNSSLGGG